MNVLQQPEQNDNCFDTGMLTAWRDGELSADQAEFVVNHHGVCADCAADERLVNNSGREVYALLAMLEPQQSAVPEPAMALSKLQANLTAKSSTTSRFVVQESLPARKITPPRNWYQRRRTWIAALVAAVLIALLMLPGAGALANQFLALFRVQEFQVVHVDPQDFHANPIPDLQDFGNLQVQDTILNTQANLTKAQAQRLVNFHILLPTYLPRSISRTPVFNVLHGGQGTFTFSASKTHTYLVQHGYTSIHIPANLNGATFTINVTSGVEINYSSPGTAPFMVAEIPSPTVRATGSASLNDLRDFLLSLPNLSPQLVAQLRQIDLNSGTLPLPVPPQVTAQHVTIHGASGLLLADNTPIGGLVIWQTHGMIYALGGSIGDATQLMAAANSLH